MVKRKHSIEQIIGKLRETEVELAQGRSVAEVCRSLGVTEQTYYRWRKEYGGLKMDQAKRLKVLEQENTRLRRAVADLTLDKQILQEVTRGNGSARRVAGSGRRMSVRRWVSRNAGLVECSADPGPPSAIDALLLPTRMP